MFIYYEMLCMEKYAYQFQGLHVHLSVLTFMTQPIHKRSYIITLCCNPRFGNPWCKVFVQWAATCNQHTSQSVWQLMAPQPIHSSTHKCKLYTMILLDYGVVVCDIASLSVSWHFEKMSPLYQGFKVQGPWNLEDAGDTFFQDIRNHPDMQRHTLEGQNPR